MSIISQLKKCSRFKELESLYALMTKSSANQDCLLMNQFITTCSAFHRTDYAVLGFTQMNNPNVFVYNAMIRGFVHCILPIAAIEFYLYMLRTQIRPTSYTFSSIVKGCVLLPALGCGKAVHGQIFRFGFGSHIYNQTALICFYSNLGKINESRQVFDEMLKKDVFAWTTMLSAHAQAQDLISARRLFDEMPERNTASWNSMIYGYAKIGDVGSAEHLFNEMPKKDLISWTTIINCYSQNKQYEKALEAFNEMKTDGVRPDEITISTVISACAHLGAFELGKEIHSYAMEIDFHLDVYIGSALVDMYAKCGNLDRSLVVFFKLQEKNLFCWNSVIEGLATHGHAEGALYMFSKMEKENIKPNGITFISILSACTHAGLVGEGRSRFLSMTSYYGIAPEIEHYGCMVDLFCKAGFLEDALELIRSMRMEPNSVIWGALLGGCKLHKNLDIAQAAVNKLVVLEPNNSGYYTLLINMYAETNRWNEVAKLRSTMKELGVEKTCPGSSWIDLNRKIHQFAATDEYHPASGRIYPLLDELYGQLKLATSAAFTSDLVFLS